MNCRDKSYVDGLHYRAIVFVIRTGRSMIDHITQITTAAENIASYYALIDPTYIQQWVLVTVSQGS